MPESKVETGEQDKEKIINDCLPYIKYTAHRLSHRLPPHLSVKDLINVGVEGLLSALTRHNEGRAKIATFVEHRIKGAMLDELRSNDWVPRSFKAKVDRIRKAHCELERELGRLPNEEEIAARLSISLDKYFQTLQIANNAVVYNFGDIGGRMHEDRVMDAMEHIPDWTMKSPLEQMEESALKKTLASLIDKLPEKEKLVLSLYYWEELTFKEISKIILRTEGRVCQLRNQALIRLRAWMSSPSIDGVPTRSSCGDAHALRGKYKVLIVDEDKSSRRLLAAHLAASGHVSVSAMDGEDALAILARDPVFDVIISEVMMKRMTAFELKARLKKHYSTQNIPVIAASTFYDRKRAQEEHGSKVDGFVLKPFEKNVLLNEIRKVLVQKK